MGIVKISRFLGYCVYICSPKLRKIAVANIDTVFGNTKTQEEKKAINVASFQSFALTTLDLFWFNKHTSERLKKYMSYDESFRVAFNDPSAIILTGHLGNWEVMAVGCGDQGYPLTSIAMPLRNPFADRELNILRTKTGCSVVARKGALRNVLKALKSGRSTLLGIDQNTLPEEGGVFVPFFGIQAPVSNVIGVLWSSMQSKVFVSWCTSDDKGYYTAYAKPSLDLRDDMTRDDITAYMMHEFESVASENPSFWLWSYKRWRFYRENDEKEKYPFYAESYERYIEHGKLEEKYQALQVAADEARKAVGSSKRTLRRRGAGEC
jgi:KDO2-lipid IV(A) lauroyltransferase